jgi:hypothetical protein
VSFGNAAQMEEGEKADGATSQYMQTDKLKGKKKK